MSDDRRLQISLFLLRFGVSIVMIMWTVDKFVRPAHTSSIFQTFYFLPGIDAWVSYVIGFLELILVGAFLIGFMRGLSYSLVLLFHLVSTLASWPLYSTPYEGTHLLAFAAWPMLAACITLVLLRHRDTFLTMEQ